MRIFLVILVLTLVGPQLGVGQEPQPQAATSEELYAQSIQLYQTGHYGEAADKFKDLSSRYPQHAPLYFNWGLAEFQNSHKGLAVGLWRRALGLQPTYTPARSALDYATQVMQLKSGREAQGLDRLREEYLGRLSLQHLLALTALLLAIGGWRAFTYLGQRRKSLREELPLPQFSWVVGALTLLFFLSLGLTVLKGLDEYVPRATAVAATPVRSGPSEASSTLFELKEGADVILRQARKGWTQIHDPGGMSGWVPNEALFQTSGMPIW